MARSVHFTIDKQRPQPAHDARRGKGLEGYKFINRKFVFYRAPERRLAHGEPASIAHGGVKGRCTDKIISTAYPAFAEVASLD